MKRILPLLLIGLFVNASFAQESGSRISVIGVHIGPAIAASLNVNRDNWKSETEKNAVTQITYDYMIKKNFSIGAVVAYQSVDLSIIDTLTSLKLEEGKVNRIYVGARGLWHYGNSKKWDLYSGVKFGMILFSPTGIKNNHGRESIIAEEHTRSSPRIGAIPFGFRYHISENIALGAQTSVGVPTMATINFNYAF